jgi:quercetin dioxygenase-like cupin family protein
MRGKGKYVEFKDVAVAELGNGFFGKNLFESGDFELTYITGDKTAGHDAHEHENVNEILIFLEGAADLNLDGKPVDVKAGSLIFAPSGVTHGIQYKAKSKVLRIKMAKQ